MCGALWRNALAGVKRSFICPNALRRYRRGVPRRALPGGGVDHAAAYLAGLTLAAAALAASCTTIDPGPNFVVPTDTFDADYFYCHVEPELIFAKQCGPGGAGDNSNCHFNASAVSGMVLTDHMPVNCGGGDHPVDTSTITTAAQGNLQSVSLEMSRDYTTAPLFLRPTAMAAHPRQIFPSNDAVVNVISTWAMK